MVTLQTGQPCIDVVMGFNKPCGELVWLSVTTEPMWGVGNTIYGVATTFTAIPDEARSPMDSPSTAPTPTQRMGDLELIAESAFFFERSLDLLAVIDLNGYFRRVNNQFSETLGYSEAELLSRPFVEFVHPGDRPATIAELEALREGSPTFQFENRYRTKDGSYRYLAWTASPQPERGVIYGIARDVTQQKEMEAALQTSEERWQLALHGSNDGIWDWNVQTHEVFFSTRWKTMLGFEEDEIDNHLAEWRKRVHPDDLEGVMQTVQDHFDRKTQFYTSEHRVQCKDGTYKWILARGQAVWDEAGNVLRMVGAHTDITKRRELEAALTVANATLEQRVAERTAELEAVNRSLQESETRFRTAVDYIPDAFVIYDAERRIQFINAAGMELTKRPIEDFLGRRDEEIQPPEATEVYLPLLKRAVATKSYQTGECTIALPNRAPYTIVVQYVPLLDEQGEIRQILGITYNITERKQVEQTIGHSEQQMRRVIDSLFSFVGVLTPDGVLVEANRTALEAADLHPDDVLGKPFEEAFWWSYSPEVQAQLRQAIARAASGEIVRYDATVQIKNDQLITIDFTLVPLFDEAGQVEYLIPSGIDISDRKQAEMALYESQKTLQRQLAEIETIYQSAPVGLNVLDPDLRFVRINEQLAEINGFPVEEHIGRTIRELLPDLADTAEALLRPIFETGEPLLNVEIRGQTPAQPGVDRIWMENFLPLKDGDRVIGINTVCEEITEQKKVEAELRQSRARLELVLASAEFGTWEVSLASEPFIAQPRSLKHDQIYGYDTLLPEWTYDTFIAHIHPDDRPFVETSFQHTLATHDDWSFECRIIRVDGAVRWVWICGSVYRDTLNQSARLMGMIADITDRKQSEEALIESEDFLRLGMQVAGFALAKFDYATNTVELSPEAAELYGLPPEELVVSRDRIHATFHPDERDALLHTVEQVLDPAGPGYFTQDHRVVWGNGEVKWLTVRKQVFFDYVGETPKPSHAILVAIDITHRKRAEEALRRSEERYRTLFEMMEDGFCIIQIIFDEADIPIDYRFMELNPAFARHTGLQNAIGHTARELIPDLEEHWFETYGNVALTGEPIRFENGSEAMQRWFDVYAFPIGQPENRQVALLFKDISDRKIIEIQREQLLQREQTARETAERANRMKDEFLAMLSHELRTPLNPILGWSKLLQAPKVDTERLQQGLSAIQRNAKQQAQLVDDLLDISRIIRGTISLNLSVISLDEPIRAALETVRLAAEAKAIDIELSLTPNIGYVRGDASRLQQVVWNLLSNSIKFTPNEGQVTVQLTADDRYAQIQVSDTGKGIHPDFLPYVFELFNQQDSSTTRSFGGLGLGLAIAKRVVEAHGGTINAASAGEGKGATFTVCLPLMPAPRPSTPTPQEQPASDLANLRILAVDDEVDSLQLVQVLLESEGAIVSTAPSATKALQLLQQSPFDLLISDLGMPRMDGYEFIQQVRTQPSANQEVLAIALTAYAGEADQRRVLAAGFQSHLAKPLDPENLLEAIAALISR